MLHSSLAGILVHDCKPAARPVTRPARLGQLAVIVALMFGASPLVMGQGVAAPQRQISARIDNEQRTVLPALHHPLAIASNDIGRVSGEEPMIAMAMHLKPTAKQSADLEELLAEQLDPKSINYHHWITAEQFGERFGADSEDLAKITAWLVSQGFAVLPAPRSRGWIDFNGTTAQAETAFNTEIHRYQATDRTFYANATAPSLPSAFAAMVREIQGLDSYSNTRPVSKSLRRGVPMAADRSARFPQPDFTGNGNYGMCAGDAQIIYNSQPLYALQPTIDGAGQTVATHGNYPATGAEFNAFRTYCGLPAQNLTIIELPGTPAGWDPGADDDEEGQLDIEWVGAMAPAAQTVYVYGTNQDSALSYVVDNHLASVVSSSWSGNAGDSLGKLANAQGITIAASSGDYGAAGGISQPSESPYVTGVGGTSFTGFGNAYWTQQNTASNTSARGYIPEQAWSGSGGGPSSAESKPSWQIGLGVPNDGDRDVPDIAMVADPSSAPYIVCQAAPCASNNFSIGGTSGATPLFAGIVALINQRTDSNGQGNINPTLYALAASVPSAFHDITSGSNGYPATVGYDMATGWGSVNALNLVEAWPIGQQNGESPTLDSISPNAVAAGSANFTLTVNGKGFPIDSQILWNGSKTGVTMQSGGTYGTQSATISSSLVAAASTAEISVSVPSWGTTDTQPISVYQPTALASLSFTPSSLTFAAQTLNTSSASQSMVVTNTGTQAVSLQEIDVEGSAVDFNQSGNCSSTLAAGSSCTLTVYFHPSGVGLRSARIVVFDSVQGSPQIMPLVGVGLGGVLELNSGQMSLVAGTYNWGFSGDGGLATSAQMQGPNQIWADPTGNIYIADSQNFVVREVTSGFNATISTIAGAESSSSGYSGNGGPATLALLDTTQGVVTDPIGNVYISTWGGTVRAIDRHGIISTFAGDDTYGFSGDGGPAVNALISFPQEMAEDAAGNLYLADAGNNRIRKITAAGVISTVAGNGGSLYAGDGGPATSAELDAPAAVAFDAAGNMYVSDQGNNRIRMVSISGQISTFAGNGVGSFSGDGGAAVSATMNEPVGLAIDAAGNMYIADSLNCRIRKVNTLGIISTVAGTGNSCGSAHTSTTSGDGGSPLNASFNQPSGLALDPWGNLLISDYGDDVVRKVTFAATATLTFATIPTGTTSAAQSVTVSNLGEAAIHISAIQYPAGYVANFVGSDCAVGVPIVPGGSCNVGVAFAPVALGGNTAVITITDDAVGGTPLIRVTGTATVGTTQVSWPSPATIAYGTPLSTTQLNAEATPSGGTYVYNPPASTVLTAGTHTLSVTYTPTDTTHYNVVTTDVSLVVTKVTPVITWITSGINYGTELGNDQLDAQAKNGEASVEGSYAYTPSAMSSVTTPLPAGIQTLSVTFTPSDTTDFNTPAPATATLIVGKTTPVISWTPGAMSYGSALSSSQLNAKVGNPNNGALIVGGSFSYNPSTGMLAAGRQSLSATFTPIDTSDYMTATATVAVTVSKATPTISWAPAPITYGTLVDATQLDATAVPSGGSFVYGTVTTNPFPAGNHTLSVTYTPSDTTDYNTQTDTVTLVVNKATPVISWAPAAITYGLVLGPNQLNPEVSNPTNGTLTVTGSFTYTPSAASLATTLLTTGTHTLSATFTPTDNTDYVPATKTVTLTVNPATTSTVYLATTTVWLTAVNNPQNAGEYSTFYAIVEHATPGTPSGAVQFRDGATVVATVALSHGFAELSTSSLSVGPHSITATYVGDQNFSGSSASLIQTILPAPWWWSLF